jgi:XTP/dITP diphosphohydrolase
MQKLMLASSNAGKVAELRLLLGKYLDLSQISLLTPRDWPTALPEVDEDGTTFAENALLKARALANATGLIALADDTGLCVDALGGRPGLHSARWAGPNTTDGERNTFLLAEMRDVPAEKRQARFVCVVALASPDGQFATAEGLCRGVILIEPVGNGGFGYDPLFLLPKFQRTMAQLTAEEKNEVSHRAGAISKIAYRLPDFLLTTV